MDILWKGSLRDHIKREPNFKECHGSHITSKFLEALKKPTPEIRDVTIRGLENPDLPGFDYTTGLLVVEKYEYFYKNNWETVSLN